MKHDIILSGYSEEDIMFEGTSDIKECTNDIEDTYVVNQGYEGSCVSQVAFEMYHYLCKVRNQGCDIDRRYVYTKRANKKVQGMMPREAFQILQREGRIEVFARIPSVEAIKKALLVNGVVMGVLPVYLPENTAFWRGSGTTDEYHAISLCAYDDEGFLFKNSWGSDWGNYGYGKIPFDEMNKCIEAWTILS